MTTKWKGLFALIPGLALVFLDQTILPVALPAIQRDLQTSGIALEWSVNIYLLFMAMLVLGAGKWSDRMGHRRALLSGMVLFVTASALCGFTSSIGWLIFARALQGAGAALIIPAQGALIASLFPPAERGRASGLNVSIGSLFLMLGPLIGGYLTEEFSWRWIFWVNLPIVAAGIPLILLLLPKSEPTKTHIDLPGFFFFAIAAAATVSFLMEGGRWGWLSMSSFCCGLVALISIALLFRRERSAAHPYLDLSLFKNSTYSAIALSISITQFILMVTIFWAIYFQTALQYSPSQAGLITFASCAPVLFVSYLGGFLSDKMGPRVPVGIGFSFLVVSCLLLGFFSAPSYFWLVVFVTVFGVGIPLIYTPSYSSAMGAVPPTKRGLAFGMLATLRSLSATIGIALIGLFMNGFQLMSLRKDPVLSVFSDKEILDFSEGVISSRIPAIQASLLEAQRSSFAATHVVLAILLFATCIVIFSLYRRKSAHHLPNSFSEGWD